MIEHKIPHKINYLKKKLPLKWNAIIIIEETKKMSLSLFSWGKGGEKWASLQSM